MIRKIKYLVGFLTMSILMGAPIYLEIVEGELSRATIMFGAWAISSFIVYAVYVGWIQIGASVAMRERYYNQMGQFPPTRDEEIVHQFAYFFDNIDSIVRDRDIEE